MFLSVNLTRSKEVFLSSVCDSFRDAVSIARRDSLLSHDSIGFVGLELRRIRRPFQYLAAGCSVHVRVC